MKWLKISLVLISLNLPAMPVHSQNHLENSTALKSYAFRLSPHQDLKNEILLIAKKHSIKAGAILTCVGGLEQIKLRFANQPTETLIKGYFEIVSLVGTFSDSTAHIHLSVSDSEGKTLGGHLLDENLIYTTAEIVIVEMTDLEFNREIDSTYGYHELTIHKKQ